MAPYAPTMNAMNSNKEGSFHSLKASIRTRMGLLMAAIAETGPIGPLERACCRQTRPSVFIRPPIKPRKKRRMLKLMRTQ